MFVPGHQWIPGLYAHRKTYAATDFKQAIIRHGENPDGPVV
jgi:hypothetical protein